MILKVSVVSELLKHVAYDNFVSRLLHRILRRQNEQQAHLFSVGLLLGSLEFTVDAVAARRLTSLIPSSPSSGTETTGATVVT